LYPTCKTNSTNYFAFLRFRTTQQQTSVSLVTPASARVGFVVFLLGYSSHLSLTSSNYFCFHQATPATRLLARLVGLFYASHIRPHTIFHPQTMTLIPLCSSLLFPRFPQTLLR